MELDGNFLVGLYLDALDTIGERKGLQLSDFTLSTDPKNDFKYFLEADPKKDYGGTAAMFVLLGSRRQIYINTKSNDYKEATSLGPSDSRDYYVYGGTQARHELFHLADSNKSEHAAYTEQKRILEKFGPDAFKNKEYYKRVLDFVEEGSRRKD